MISIAQYELSEPPDDGALMLPMTREGRYLISVVYDGKVVGGPSDRPFRSVNIAHKQHKQGSQVGRVAFDDRAPVS